MKRKQLISALMIATVVSQSSILMASEELTKSVETSIDLEVKEIEIDTSSVSEVTASLELVEGTMKNEYISKTGKITEINKEGECYTILVGTPIDGIVYVLDNSEMIIDAKTLGFLQPSDLEVGMEITVIIPENAPMTMSLPAMISDQTAIVVNSSETVTYMGYFDENLVNQEQTLKLNIDRQTYITNIKGERRVFTAEDVQHQRAVVIYSIATQSIPAQTNPNMVLILPTIEVDNSDYLTRDSIGEVDEVVVQADKAEGDIEQLEVMKTVPMRDLAEKYGYEIAWDNQNKIATLVKDENTIVVSVGKAEVAHNGKVYTLKEAAQIENQKLIVSNELENLL